MQLLNTKITKHLNTQIKYVSGTSTVNQKTFGCVIFRKARECLVGTNGVGNDP